MSEEEFVARLTSPRSWTDPAFRQMREWLIANMSRIEGMAEVEPTAWLGRVVRQSQAVGDELAVVKAELDTWVEDVFGDQAGAIVERWLAKEFVVVSSTDMPDQVDVPCYRIKKRFLVR